MFPGSSQGLVPPIFVQQPTMSVAAAFWAVCRDTSVDRISADPRTYRGMCGRCSRLGRVETHVTDVRPVVTTLTRR